jgi:hypothetical protein
MFTMAELSHLAGKILLTIGAVCLVAGLGLQAEPYADGLHRIIAAFLLGLGAISAAAALLVGSLRRWRSFTRSKRRPTH